MTRAKKIERIKTYRPHLYMILAQKVHKLLENPEKASKYDIETYNYYIAQESSRDHNKTAFKNRFSF